ncbi:MAG: tellurium resistance protein TerC, partial [Poseidonibacter sp.]
MLNQLSGILIFVSFFLSIYSYFINNDFLIYAGLSVWIAFLLLFLSLKNIKMVTTLLVLSMIAFYISYLNDFTIDFKKAFTVNQYLLTLLIGVGFLRLIASPKKDKSQILPKGKESFLKTYLGVHLFGSVINLSSLILVADKLYKKGPLSNAQIILLTRAFASDAYWSPFFVAFAAAITYAPLLSTSIILVNGLFLALIAFLFTYAEVIKNKDLRIDEFQGYPVSFQSLILPFSLAFLGLISNHYFPNIKVIILI